MNGAESPKSEIKPIEGPALMLRGDASIMARHSVSQKFPARSGESYSLEFESRVKGIKREGRQHNNCYVGVMIFDANGQRVLTSIKDLSRNSDWKRHRIDFKVPPSADKTEVIIFLSKTGTLTVENLLLSETSGRGPRGS